MNDKKIKQLFKATRNEPSPAPSGDFESRVLRTIRLDRSARGNGVSLVDALESLFPRLALASALVIVACVVGDYVSSPTDSSGLTGDVAQLSEQWPFAEEEF